VTTRRVLTDNGGGYISREFGRICDDLGIKHRRTKPYHPRTNGKAERLIQNAAPRMYLPLLVRQLSSTGAGPRAVSTLLQSPPWPLIPERPCADQSPSWEQRVETRHLVRRGSSLI
jgi:transposase InsO family protein